MKQKLFTILTLLLCLCSGAWADDTFVSLRTVDFTLLGSYTNFSTTDKENHVTETGYTDIVFYTSNSNKPITINASTGVGVDFAQQNYGGSSFIAIPLSNVNGKIKVTFYHQYSSNKAKFKVGYIDGATSYVTNASVNEVQDGANADTQCAWTSGTLTNANGYLYIGEASSSYRYIKKIVIETLESSGKPKPGLNVSPTALTLALNGTQQITASATSTGTITYSSNNTNVATVNSTGLITAVGVGNAEITTSIAETDSYDSDQKVTKVIVTPAAVTITKYATFDNALSSSPSGYFTISETGTTTTQYNTKYAGTYAGENYSYGLKFQNGTAVNFTTTTSCDLVVVQSLWSDQLIKIDGTTFSRNYDTQTYYDDATNKVRVYTIKNLAAGSHSITRNSEFGMLYIGVTEPLAPSLTVSPTSATAFAYVVDNGPSAAQTFTVTGSNLTGTITATLSNTTNYEMKTGDGEFGAGPLTDLASGTAVQVRLKSGLALGDSYSGNLTFSSTGADDKAIALSGSVTNQKYSITEGTHTNGDITIDKETAEEGDEVTLTATPDFKYVFGSWSVYKTGEPATTVTVTNNQFTMPAYAVTVDATFTADPKKQVLYLTSNGNVNANDKLFAALAEDYTVTKAAFDATKTVTDFDLVVFHESIGGGNYNKNLVKAAIEADVPVLNTKSYFYGADQNANDRWKWGAPNAGTSVDGATINPAYGNIASHPIFDGVDISDAGFVTLFNAATEKAMQPVTTLASGKEGYTLAITPNVAAVGGNGVAIHELSAAQRGLSSGSAKYLMVSIGNGNGCFEKLTANGQKLLKNAAAYLIDNTASWTPTTSVSGTITASGWNTFSSYATLDLSKINGGAAYVASATSGNSVTLTPVTDKIVAAGTGLMIKGTAGDDFTIDVATADADFTGTNLLVGLPNGGEVAKANNTDTWNYVFGWTDPTDPGFYLVNAKEPTLGAGKAYLQTTAALSTTTPARLNIVFEGETTAINGIEEVDPVTKTRKVVKNGRLVIETANGEFTVSGARVK